MWVLRIAYIHARLIKAALCVWLPPNYNFRRAAFGFNHGRIFANPRLYRVHGAVKGIFGCWSNSLHSLGETLDLSTTRDR
jgi:hypothetical protein